MCVAVVDVKGLPHEANETRIKDPDMFVVLLDRRIQLGCVDSNFEEEFLGCYHRVNVTMTRVGRATITGVVPIDVLKQRFSLISRDAFHDV